MEREAQLSSTPNPLSWGKVNVFEAEIVLPVVVIAKTLKSDPILRSEAYGYVIWQ